MSGKASKVGDRHERPTDGSDPPDELRRGPMLVAPDPGEEDDEGWDWDAPRPVPPSAPPPDPEFDEEWGPAPPPRAARPTEAPARDPSPAPSSERAAAALALHAALLREEAERARAAAARAVGGTAPEGPPAAPMAPPAPPASGPPPGPVHAAVPASSARPAAAAPAPGPPAAAAPASAFVPPTEASMADAARQAARASAAPVQAAPVQAAPVQAVAPRPSSPPTPVRPVPGLAGVTRPVTRPVTQPPPRQAETVTPKSRASWGALAIRRTWRAFLAALVLLATGAVATAALLWWGMRDLPLADILPPAEEASLSVRTAQGEVLTQRGTYRAPFAPLDAFPPALVDAVLAIEDRRFREHRGVDPRGVTRALLRNIGAGQVVQGGSTITQQLVKILYLEPDRTLRRKLQELALALMLERQLGKDRILELYLNSVYLGAGAHGMPAAAQTYFGKEVGQLSLAESALLAASIRQPSEVNPLADLSRAQNRAALVLALMAEQERLEPAARDEALARLAATAPAPPATRAGGYFTDWVLAEAARLGLADNGGADLVATLDPGLQAAAERVVQEVMATDGAAAGATQAALVAMTPSGEVRAMVGGLDYGTSQFNRATDALRQPGSAFKLFVYMAAFVMGATPDRVVQDAPITIDGWAPANIDGTASGPVTIREAFVRSLNLATVALAQDVGMENIIAVARQFGIESALVDAPSLALGTSEVTLLDLTEAYAAMASGRAPVHATGLASVRLGDGREALEVTRLGPVGQVQLNRTREPMLDLLRGVVTDGTGRSAALSVPAWGKTGTSQDNRDAWFVGFIDGLVVGVWVGNDDNAPMADVTGGTIPAEIWSRVMESVVGAAANALQDDGTPAVAPPPAGPQCNVAACAATFRSFDPATCTYQPLEGPRRLCDR